MVNEPRKQRLSHVEIEVYSSPIARSLQPVKQLVEPAEVRQWGRSFRDG